MHILLVRNPPAGVAPLWGVTPAGGFPTRGMDEVSLISRQQTNRQHVFVFVEFMIQPT